MKDDLEKKTILADLDERLISKFTNTLLELILVDDSSQDNSVEVLPSLKDQRIRLMRNKKILYEFCRIYCE